MRRRPTLGALVWASAPGLKAGDTAARRSLPGGRSGRGIAGIHFLQNSHFPCPSWRFSYGYTPTPATPLRLPPRLRCKHLRTQRNPPSGLLPLHTLSPPADRRSDRRKGGAAPFDPREFRRCGGDRGHPTGLRPLSFPLDPLLIPSTLRVKRGGGSRASWPPQDSVSVSLLSRVRSQKQFFDLAGDGQKILPAPRFAPLTSAPAPRGVSSVSLLSRVRSEKNFSFLAGDGMKNFPPPRLRRP